MEYGASDADKLTVHYGNDDDTVVLHGSRLDHFFSIPVAGESMNACIMIHRSSPYFHRCPIDFSRVLCVSYPSTVGIHVVATLLPLHWG